MKKNILIGAILLLFISPALALALQGKCVKVADGDTITVLTAHEEVRVRIYGVDSPEKSQNFGQKAKKFTLGLVGGKHVKVDVIDTDRYGRAVGVVYVGRKCLNEELLKFGYAWYYGKYCKKLFCRKWRDLETKARVNRVGLWGDPHAQAPWDFRRKGKGATPKKSMKAPVASGAYHGNVNSHKFHRPGCRHYNCKACTAVFESRAAAVNAGYVPCGICRP